MPTVKATLIDRNRHRGWTLNINRIGRGRIQISLGMVRISLTHEQTLKLSNILVDLVEADG